MRFLYTSIGILVMSGRSTLGTSRVAQPEILARLRTVCPTIGKELGAIPSSLNDFPFEHMSKSEAILFCAELGNHGHSENIDRLRSAIESRLNEYTTKVHHLIETCKTTASDLSLIHQGSVDKGLLDLEDVVVRGEGILSQDRKDSLCWLARTRRTDEWTDFHKKLVYGSVAEINYYRHEWPQRWQSAYENRCAESGAFVRLGDHSPKDESDMIYGILAMKTRNQRFELCQLVAEPISGGVYPREQVDELIRVAKKVNTNSPTFYDKCSGTIPLRSWVSIPARVLDEFEKVVIKIFSEDDIGKICSIFMHYLHERRASSYDDKEVEQETFAELKSIETRHGFGIMRAVRRIGEGLKGRVM